MTSLRRRYDALRACISMDGGGANDFGRLATIHNQRENDCLAQALGNRQAWIGLTDEEPWSENKQDFVWAPNIGEDHAGTPMYTNWDSGEPKVNNDGCGRLYGSSTPVVGGKWNDDTCTKTASYVCETERILPDVCPGTSTDGHFTSLPACPDGWSVYTGCVHHGVFLHSPASASLHCT
jgi:hypothetical protein